MDYDYAYDKHGNCVYIDEADKKEEYFCPTCGGKVIPRQGSINEWHFAHAKGECTDSWHYDMSEWHKRMQGYFKPEHREVVVEFNGKKHRADVLKDNTVVEFQHSPISADEFFERNSFYTKAGYRVAWVIDVADRLNRQIKCTDPNHFNTFQWSHPEKFLTVAPAPHDKGITNISICFCFTTEFGEDGTHEDGGIYKVLWATSDYKHFKINDSCGIDAELNSDMSMDLFFYTPEQWLQFYIKNLPRYQIRNCGFKGQPYQSYQCPVVHGWTKISNCDYCQYCGLIDAFHPTKEKNGCHIYCCYPTVVRESENDYAEMSDNPNFQCEPAKRIHRESKW